ncbi:MAG: hypothetical protein JXA13_09900 [Anaerolineales bacterium]|nr:hypothetical protein [Anaerolineales bacterium]
MQITRIDLKNKRQVRDFLALPFHIYRDNPCWVPPLQMDERVRLDPKRYPFYRHSAAEFFLAYEGSQPIGRLAVIANRHYNDFNKEQTAFFYLFECENNQEAARGLFDAGFSWARERGLTRMIGPKGFTPLDGAGLLVKGFDLRPAFGQPYNPDYYPDLIEAQGFKGFRELDSGHMSASLNFPERIHELSERIQKRRGLHIARYRTRRELRSLVSFFRELYNGSLAGTRENTPLTEEEANIMANQLIWFADPQLVKIVMKGQQAVGFLLAYPDISAALQKTRGRLFPFGWLTLLREMKRTDFLNLNGAGLLEEYRGLGGTAILFSEIYKSATETGQFTHGEVVQIGTENKNMQREMKNFGIDFYKTHRVYRREIGKD